MVNSSDIFFFQKVQLDLNNVRMINSMKDYQVPQLRQRLPKQILVVLSAVCLMSLINQLKSLFCWQQDNRWEIRKNFDHCRLNGSRTSLGLPYAQP